MKKSILLTFSLMVAVCLSFQHLNGQEKTQEQKEKDEKLRMAIEAQKKAIADQKKAFDLQQLEFDKSLQDANEAVDKTTGTISVIGRSKPRISRDFSSHSYFVTPDANFSGNGFFFNNGGDGERTTWDFSKYVKEATFSKQYSFDVENSAESVVMMVMGDCKEGEIRVKIIMPGGKVYSDILIDESGNLNWRKSFTISDTENKDKAGEWLFKIEATKATGSFKISLQTY